MGKEIVDVHRGKQPTVRVAEKEVVDVSKRDQAHGGLKGQRQVQDRLPQAPVGSAVRTARDTVGFRVKDAVYTCKPHSIAGGAYGLWQAVMDLALTLRTAVALVALDRGDNFLSGDTYGWLLSSMHTYDLFANGKELLVPMTEDRSLKSPDMSRAVCVKAVYDICKDESASQPLFLPFLAEILRINVRVFHRGKPFPAGCRNIHFVTESVFDFTSSTVTPTMAVSYRGSE